MALRQVAGARRCRSLIHLVAALQGGHGEDWRGLQQIHLRRVLLGDGDFLLRLGLRDGGEGDGDVVGLELGEDRLGAVDDGEGQTRETCDLDAVAAVGSTGDDAANADDPSANSAMNPIRPAFGKRDS